MIRAAARLQQQEGVADQRPRGVTESLMFIMTNMTMQLLDAIWNLEDEYE